MRLPTILALAPLISLATADSMLLTSGCGANGCDMSAVWRSPNSADRYFYPMPGCHARDSIPGMKELCLDMSQRRGHFYFDNSDVKRCIKAGESKTSGPCTSAEDCYSETTWEEVEECNW
jgi:hypothetical protein